MFFAVSSPSQCLTLEVTSITEAVLDVMAGKIMLSTTISPTKSTKISTKNKILTSRHEEISTTTAREPGNEISSVAGPTRSSTNLRQKFKTCTWKKNVTLATVHPKSKKTTPVTEPKDDDRNTASDILKTCLPLVNVMIVLSVALSLL